MKDKNLMIVKRLAAAMMVVAAPSLMAETVQVPASVTVNNAIDFTVDGTLNFGEVRATAVSAATTCAGLTMPTTSLTLAEASGGSFDTTCTTVAGALQAVGGTPSRPTFTIAGVAPFTTLTLTLPTGVVNLTAATGPGTPQFRVIDIVARKTSGSAQDISGTTFMTDADGGATFTVGATLITDPTAYTATTAQYQEMTYSGQFEVAVTY